MDTTLLNRVGIVLNFLAGFMLAPELLGVERLRKAEIYLEQSLGKHNQFSRDYLVKVRNILQEAVQGIVVIIVLVIIGLIVAIPIGILKTRPTPNGTFDAIFIGISIYFAFGMFISAEIFGTIMEKLDKSKLQNILSSKAINFITFLLMFIITLIVPSLIAILLFLLISSSLLLVLSSIILLSFYHSTEFILHKLQGEKRLRSLLIWWGITFFIFGNLLQFLATF
jgi:uncharacterized membrane protein